MAKKRISNFLVEIISSDDSVDSHFADSAALPLLLSAYLDSDIKYVINVYRVADDSVRGDFVFSLSNLIRTLYEKDS